MMYGKQDKALVLAEPGKQAECPTCSANLIAKCGDTNVWHWAHENKDCDPWYEPESEWHREWKSHVPKGMTEVVIGVHRADIVASNGTIVELQHSPISYNEIRERETFYKNIVWIFDARNWHLKFKDESLILISNCFKAPLNGGGYVSFLSDFSRDVISFPDKHDISDLIYTIKDMIFCGFKKEEIQVILTGYKKKHYLSDREYNLIYQETLNIINDDIEVSFRWKWPHRSLEAVNGMLFLDLGDNKIIQITWLDFYKYKHTYGKGRLITKSQVIQMIKEP
jgi:hypothetical protein